MQPRIQRASEPNEDNCRCYRIHRTCGHHRTSTQLYCTTFVFHNDCGRK
jgi:hypothetical protein